MKILLFGLIIFGGCQSKYELEKQPRTNLKFDDLPNDVKKIYLESIEPEKIINENGDTITMSKKLGIICLNPEIEKCEHETKWFASFVSEYLFKIDKKVFRLDFNGNTINKPYVLLDKQLYFRITKNLRSIEDVKGAEYGKFNLTDKLKK